ncbi:MAG TPA: lipocalin family protein [Herpetosiphonaceae bacterium]|nr:lipocalin family protein [Herpetosiphonaceae bacterium]
MRKYLSAILLVILAACAAPTTPAEDVANVPAGTAAALATQQVGPSPAATSQSTATPNLPPTATLVPTATSVPPTATRTRIPTRVPATTTSTRTPTADLATTSTGVPATAATSQVNLPRDEAPHNVLTEWWYYHGHLEADDGTEYGFHSVIFQLRRQNLPTVHVGHAAITDPGRNLFRYDQELGMARSGAGPSFDFRLGSWLWSGSEQGDHLEFSIPDYALNLDLTALKSPAVHQAGFTELGPIADAGYYSRTRMELRGTLDDHDQRKEITGQAWFDHQWGNFIPEELGGWDWFGIQLEDGADFALALLRGDQEEVLGGFGTYVAADGGTLHIDNAEMQIEALGSWTSPHTRVTYPSGWRLTLPGQDLELVCTPILQDQELDVRETSAMSYWEGQVRCEGTRDSAPLAGQGYVELIGYDRP